MRIVGVNGIRTHGEGSIDLLLLEIAQRGHVVIDVPLPKRHALSARWGGEEDGEIIAKHTKDGDVIVAHSFGCYRAWHAHKHRDFRAIICIAPAMSHKSEWRHPERVHCLHSKKDFAVWVGAHLFMHPFGAAGVHGFTQEGVTNVEYDCGHSEYFSPALLPRVADYVERVAWTSLRR